MTSWIRPRTVAVHHAGRCTKINAPARCSRVAVDAREMPRRSVHARSACGMDRHLRLPLGHDAGALILVHRPAWCTATVRGRIQEVIGNQCVLRGIEIAL